MSGGPKPDLGPFVRCASERGELVVQPRMGMSDPAEMREGVRAVAELPVTTVSTVTLDSYTRCGDHESARQALVNGDRLNGFPVVAHGAGTTAGVADAAGTSAPVQVRHGSPRPTEIFAAMVRAGVFASEGGPVSYCLPYGRTPLAESLSHWSEATELLAAGGAEAGRRAHLETFGGCLLGQLCPPSMLVAMSLLESLYFVQHGVGSVSLSYAQQVDPVQDVEALAALRHLAERMIPPAVDWHVVMYTYMGVYPRTAEGTDRLLDASAEVAVRGGAERLIVKTRAESARIPTVPENLLALTSAHERAEWARGSSAVPSASTVDFSGVLREARMIVEAVLEQDERVGEALRKAFARGLLDVPFCLHADNPGRAQGAVGDDGRLVWSDTGGLPLPSSSRGRSSRLGSGELLGMLHHLAERCDSTGITGEAALSSVTGPSPEQGVPPEKGPSLEQEASTEREARR